MTPIKKRQGARFYIYKDIFSLETFIYIQKFRHFDKSKTICVPFLFTKTQKLYFTWFFMKFLKEAFIYIFKMHDTFCYVTFYIKKSRHFEKSKTICVTFFFNIQKALHFALRNFSSNLWNWRRRRTFLYTKNSLYVNFVH